MRTFPASCSLGKIPIRVRKKIDQSVKLVSNTKKIESRTFGILLEGLEERKYEDT